MSTLSRCASSAALRSGFTLKATITAPEVDASSTSLSFTAPTFARITFSFTWSFESFGSISFSTSTEPCTSALTTTGNSFTSPIFNCSCNWSSVKRTLDDMSCLGFIRHLKLVARFGHALQAQNFDGCRRTSLLDGAATIVEHCAHLAVHRAHDKHIAHMQRAVLHDHSGYRSATFIHARFQHGSLRRHVGIGLQFAHVTDQQNHFQQLGNIFLGFGGNFHHHRVAAPIFRHQTLFRQLPLHALYLRVRLIHFVDRDDDRHAGSPRVRNCFFGLRHHAVIGRYDQHDDVRHLGAARTHACERFVTRRIHKHDALALHVRLVGANVLRDSAGLAARHVRFTNGVQQTGFAVIHVTHYGHDRSARHFVARALFLHFFFLHQLFFERDHLHHAVERFGQIRRSRHIQRLIDAGKYTAVEQRLEQILRANVQLLRELAHRDSFGYGQCARLTLHRRNGFHGCGASARTYARAWTNWM